MTTQLRYEDVSFNEVIDRVPFEIEGTPRIRKLPSFHPTQIPSKFMKGRSIV